MLEVLVEASPGLEMGSMEVTVAVGRFFINLPTAPVLCFARSGV